MIMLLLYLTLLIGVACYAAHNLTEKNWLGVLGTGAVILAWTLLLATLTLRGLISGHWPLGTHYEFALCFIWIIAGVYLILERVWKERRTGAFAATVLLLLSTYPLAASPETRAIGPLPPVLRSPWLQGHVLTAMVGYGAFGVAAALSLARLAHPGTDRGFPTRFAPVEQIDYMIERLIAIGFPWLSLGILTGAIWAHQAWGRYWGWDPKETWALISWLWFLMILHLRPLRRWRGRRLAWLTLMGFALILFTFIGVPRMSAILQLDTLHGY